MKIIKNGDITKLRKIKTFDCDFCGCLFEADSTEYRIGCSQYDETYYYIKCPFCGRNVYKDVQEG